MKKELNNSVSCIIPAYNEAGRVSNVLKVILKCPYIRDVIIINDGSTDTTLKEIKKFEKNKKLNLIDLKENKGKSYAVAIGIESAKKEIILLLDSDLIGLNNNHIKSLIIPIINNKVEMTMGLLDNSYKIHKNLGVDFTSGQRALKKSLIEDLNQLKKIEKYGLEVFLNDIVISKRKKIKVARLLGLSNTTKPDKYGKKKGAKLDLNMSFQIIRRVGIFGIIKQNYWLRKLKI